MVFQLTAKGLSACCCMGASSDQNGLDATDFVVEALGNAALAGATVLAACVNPTVGKASVSITKVAASLERRHCRPTLEKTA